MLKSVMYFKDNIPPPISIRFAKFSLKFVVTIIFMDLTSFPLIDVFNVKSIKLCIMQIDFHFIYTGEFLSQSKQCLVPIIDMQTNFPSKTIRLILVDLNKIISSLFQNITLKQIEYPVDCAGALLGCMCSRLSSGIIGSNLYTVVLSSALPKLKNISNKRHAKFILNL
jgi:hypothetical protein